VSIRFPRGFAPGRGRGPRDPIGYELLQEAASSLRRTAERLEEALSALRTEGAAATPPDPNTRAGLVAAAAKALFGYVVQREGCGLRDMDLVLRELDIPREVWIRMGPVPDGRVRDEERG
jgi:hypothetical protein